MKRGSAGCFEVAVDGGERVRAFVPAPLPPGPPLDLSAPQDRLAAAHLALGRLDTLSTVLPDTGLFPCAYVRKEALLSSQIEGTQSFSSDLLRFEVEPTPGGPWTTWSRCPGSRHHLRHAHGLRRPILLHRLRPRGRPRARGRHRLRSRSHPRGRDRHCPASKGETEAETEAETETGPESESEAESKAGPESEAGSRGRDRARVRGRGRGPRSGAAIRVGVGVEAVPPVLRPFPPPPPRRRAGGSHGCRRRSSSHTMRAVAPHRGGRVPRSNSCRS